MYCIHITRFGGPETLKAADTLPAALPPDGVRIRASAAGINFADVMMRIGLYPEAPRPPFVPGYEIAGVVVETGPLAGAAFRPGDRVLAVCRFGGYASETVLPASQVRKIPERLSDIEAAALPVNFITAWIALMEMARIRGGDRVLIPGAAGGVGTAAVQIATREGADAVALVGSPAKKDAVDSLGAREVYTYGEWETRKKTTDNRFNAIIDSRGGSSQKRHGPRAGGIPGGEFSGDCEEDFPDARSWSGTGVSAEQGEHRQGGTDRGIGVGAFHTQINYDFTCGVT